VDATATKQKFQRIITNQNCENYIKPPSSSRY